MDLTKLTMAEFNRLEREVHAYTAGYNPSDDRQHWEEIQKAWDMVRDEHQRRVWEVDARL